MRFAGCDLITRDDWLLLALPFDALEGGETDFLRLANDRGDLAAIPGQFP